MAPGACGPTYRSCNIALQAGAAAGASNSHGLSVSPGAQPQEDDNKLQDIQAVQQHGSESDESAILETDEIVDVPEGEIP